jgi:hypothetical protein
MPGLISICYASSAVRPLSEAAMTALLDDARAFNAEAGVTGVLLHDDGSFFQYFEGPSKGVGEVYSRILKSRSHHHVIELLNDPVEGRAFSQWHMGSTLVPHSAILSLRAAKWRQLKERVDFGDGSNLGLILLRMHLAMVDVAF